MKSRWKIVQKTAPFSQGAKKNALRVSKNAFAVHGHASGMGPLCKWNGKFGPYFGIMKRVKAVGILLPSL